MTAPGKEAAAGIRASAVALGVVADKLAFLTASAGLAAVLPTTSASFAGLALALGFACTTLGAFVAAVRAGRRPLPHALLVALVAFLLSFARFVLFSVRPPGDPGALHPLPWELAGWALVFLAGLSGGLAGRRLLARRRRRSP
jgi:hypothetical protein